MRRSSLPSTLDAIASLPHFVDHIRPIWNALPEEMRGTFHAGRGMRPPRSDVPTLVASSGDLRRARKLGRPVALMEHGAGQSYGGDLRAGRHPSYAGGERRDAELFLHPGPHPAARDRARYPHAKVEIIGCPRLDSLPAREGDDWPVVALSFHWDCRLVSEARSAFRFYRAALPELASAFRVIGHCHPRIAANLTPVYRAAGIEMVQSFEDVCRRADVYACDNSSTLFEFAATGRPVVVLNVPWYRRNVSHGLRFWEASRVGINVDHPDGLRDAIDLALADPSCARRQREAALDLVYSYRTYATSRATAILWEWVHER